MKRQGGISSWKQLKKINLCADRAEVNFVAVPLAAGEGFEPSQTDPESVVLPLHNPASLVTEVIIAQA